MLLHRWMIQALHSNSLCEWIQVSINKFEFLLTIILQLANPMNLNSYLKMFWISLFRRGLSPIIRYSLKHLRIEVEMSLELQRWNCTASGRSQVQFCFGCNNFKSHVNQRVIWSCQFPFVCERNCSRSSSKAKREGGQEGGKSTCSRRSIKTLIRFSSWRKEVDKSPNRIWFWRFTLPLSMIKSSHYNFSPFSNCCEYFKQCRFVCFLPFSSYIICLGETALHYAAKAGNFDIVEALVAHWANFTMKSEQVSLHWADSCWFCGRELQKILLPASIRFVFFLSVPFQLWLG